MKNTSWSVELGIPHIAVLLGLVTGSMALSYYLGALAGRTVGFEAAQEAQLAQLPKLPVVPPALQDERQVEAEALASLDIAKLQQDETSVVVEPKADEAIQKVKVEEEKKPLAPIASADSLNKLLEEREQEVTKQESIDLEKEEKKARLIEQKKKEVITEKVEEPKKKITKIPKGWFAQVAAPRAEGDATALQKKLKSSGFSSHIEQAVIDGQTFYRVLVGPAENKSKAELTVAKLKGKNLASGQPFIKVVK